MGETTPRDCGRHSISRLHLVDRDDPVCEIVANKIIEIGLDGTHDPQEIAELAIKRLGT